MKQNKISPRSCSGITIWLYSRFRATVFFTLTLLTFLLTFVFLMFLVFLFGGLTPILNINDFIWNSSLRWLIICEVRHNVYKHIYLNITTEWNKFIQTVLRKLYLKVIWQFSLYHLSSSEITNWTTENRWIYEDMESSHNLLLTIISPWFSCLSPWLYKGLKRNLPGPVITAFSISNTGLTDSQS